MPSQTTPVELLTPRLPHCVYPKTRSTGAVVECISKWGELQTHMCGTHLRTQAGVGSHTNPTVADYARPNPTVADYHGPNIKQLNFHLMSTPTPCRGGWGRQNVDAALGKLHVVALHPGARASDVLLRLLLVRPRVLPCLFCL